jgi:hypothetical protein
MRQRSRFRHGLRHCDRWGIADMLGEQPDLGCEDLAPDIDPMAASIINLIEGQISDAPVGVHMIRLMN